MQEPSLTEIEDTARESDGTARSGTALLDDNVASERALTVLRKEATSGKSAAQNALARRLLTKPPCDLQAGVSWALEAARNGSGESARLVALLRAWGLGLPQDWRAALLSLQAAADLDWKPAQIELAALAREWELVRNLVTGEQFQVGAGARLRAKVDLAGWLAPCRARAISSSPRIGVIDGFLAPELCDWIIESARPNLTRAKVYNPSAGARDDLSRTNSEHHFRTFDSDLLIMITQHRMAAVTGLPTAGMEACTALHYAVGEEFLPHYDYFDVSTNENARRVAQDGQRVLTFLIYLNDGYSGGETDFPILGRRYKGKKGDALFFWNIRPDFMPDSRTFHAGLPPMRGEKWLLSQWIRGRPPA